MTLIPPSHNSSLTYGKLDAIGVIDIVASFVYETAKCYIVCRSPSQSCYRSDRKRRRGVSSYEVSVVFEDAMTEMFY